MADSERTARLSDHAPALTAFAHAVGGRALRLVAEGNGSDSHGDVELPAAIALAADAARNRAVYLARVAVVAAGRRVARASTASGSATIDRGMVIDAVHAPATGSRVERARAWLAKELPGFESFVEELARGVPAHVIFEGCEREIARAVDLRQEALSEPDGATSQRSPDAQSVSSEAEAARVGRLETVELERNAGGDVLLNPFERTETLDQWRGGSRQLDAADDLEAHLDALSEVELGKLVRTSGTAGSVLRADARIDSDRADCADATSPPEALHYDEWDERRQAYRRGWCTVEARPWPTGDPEWALEAMRGNERRIEMLVRSLAQQAARFESLGRRDDGEEIDVAAVVEAHGDRRAGLEGDARLYRRRSPRRRDVALTLVLDVSLSTESWLAGRAVIDRIREVAVVTGGVANRLGDRVSVLAFASQTRHRCRVWEVLGWDEPWRRGVERLGALRPTGYTRMGPGIRHAAAGLRAVEADRRTMLVVSDAKPTDFDRYEGRYGMADVRQAVREAARDGILVHGFSIDREPRSWLSALFGSGAWHLVRDPRSLTEAVLGLHARSTVARLD